jgi:hypothetical protein
MSLASLLTETASTKRPRMSGGSRTAQAHLSGLKCKTPHAADPIRRNQLMQELKLETLYKLWETFVDGVQDLEAGDLFVLNGKEYLVRAAAPWTMGPEPFTQVTMEEQIEDA